LLELHIEGFKSIKNQTIVLQPLTVLIGANGAGKSNLVGFLAMLSRMLTGGLQEWVKSQAGANNILHFGANRTPVLNAKIQFETGKGRNFYEFSLKANNELGLFVDREVVGFQKTGTENFFQVPLDSNLGWESKLSGIRKASPFPGLTPVQQKTCAVIATLLRECQAYQFHDTTPFSKIRTPSGDHLNRFLHAHGGNLPTWLHRLGHTHPDNLAFIERTIGEVFPDFGGFILEVDPVTHSIPLLWKHRATGEIFAAHHLSDGTIRFIALCSLLLQPIELMPDIVLIDEPELGLHPTALQILAAMAQSAVAQGKQVIMTTQSPSFLSCFTPKDVVVVESENGCSVFRSMKDREEDLAQWLEKFEKLGTLWEMNILGGQP